MYDTLRCGTVRKSLYKTRRLEVGSLVVVRDIWDEQLDTWIDCPETLAIVVESYSDESDNNMIHLHIPHANYMYNVPYYDNEIKVLQRP